MRGSSAGTTSVVSRTTGTPTAIATGALQNARPDDSGLMMPGYPRDRNVRTQYRFEPGLSVHAHVHQRSNSARFASGVHVGARVIPGSNHVHLMR